MGLAAADSDLDRRLRQTLADRGSTLPATPDPVSLVTRAVARDRRRRRTAMLGAGLAAVAVLALAGTGLARDQVLPHSPRPGNPIARGTPIADWPAQGPLASDPAFLSAARDRATLRGGPVAHVLYAGDVGDTRLVLSLDGACAGSPGCDEPVVQAWTSAAGADADELTKSATGTLRLDDGAVAWVRADADGPSPWVVLTPGSVSASGPRLNGSPLAVELSPAPGFLPDGQVQRSWQRWPGGSPVASGDLGPLRGATARVRVLQAADVLYDGPVQVVDTSRRRPPDGATGEVLAAHNARLASRNAGIAADALGDVAPSGDAVAAAVRELARQHVVLADEVQVVQAWNGRTAPGTTALVLWARVSDGANVVLVRETGPAGTVDAVPGRTVPASSVPAPVLWRQRDDGHVLSVVAPGTTSATYRGSDAVPFRLTAAGYGSVPAAGPSGIANPPYEVVSFYRHGTLVAEQPVPATGADGDPLDLLPFDRQP